MKKKTLYKFMILILCGALMVLSFTACTKEEPTDPPEEPEQEEPAEPETEPTEPAEAGALVLCYGLHNIMSAPDDLRVSSLLV